LIIQNRYATGFAIIESYAQRVAGTVDGYHVLRRHDPGSKIINPKPFTDH